MKSLIILWALLLPIFASTQPIPIKGTVINTDNEPIIGATVKLRPANRTTLSAEDGSFSFTASRITDTLEVSAAGYETLWVPNNTRGLHTIMLKRKAGQLTEVVVSSGYQQIPKERASGSFETINNEMLNRRVSTDLLSRLEGVSTVQFDNRRGSREPLTIRGQSTLFGNAAPLVVVDNVPYEAGLENINPNDVESITLLKDAAAASIWGARAGNGVIVVTTKKGKFNVRPALNFNSNITFENRPDLWYNPALSSEEFIGVETFLFNNRFFDAALNNRVTFPVLSPVVEILASQRVGTLSPEEAASMLNELKQNDVRNDLNRYIYQGAIRWQNALQYTGGGSNFHYSLSGGYDKNRENLQFNQSERITFLSQATYKPASWVSLNLSINNVSFKNSAPNNAAGFWTGIGGRLQPYLRFADDNGQSLAIPRDYRSPFTDTAGRGVLLDWKYRPLDDMRHIRNESQRVENRYNLQADFKIRSWLNTTLVYQLQQQRTETETEHGVESYFTRNLINLYYNRAANRFNIPIGAILDQGYSRLTAQTFRLQNNLQWNWNDQHNISGIVGVEARDNRTVGASWRVYGYDPEVRTFVNVNFIDNFQIYNNLATQRPIPNPSSFSEQNLRFFSAFSNMSYSYKGRYILTASARRDASNIFGVNSNQKWVPLWSAGGAWIISKEPFYHSEKIPTLKWRVSWGINGNIDNTVAAVTTIRFLRGALYTQLPFATVQNVPNPELRWEQMRVFNTGIDLSTKNNRIRLTADYFIKNGRDLIGLLPIDPTTGVQTNGSFSVRRNVAATAGTGWELILNTVNTTGKIKWSTQFIWNQVEVKVSRYERNNINAQQFLNNGTVISPLEGNYLYAIYAYRWAGLDPNTGDPQGFIGREISKNYNALTNVTVNDLLYKGSALPLIFGSVMNTIEWRQWSLSANLIYKLKYWFRRPSINYSNLINNVGAHPDFIRRWQKPGDEQTTYVPSFVFPIPTIARESFYTSSDVLTQRGDHIRLQDITLSWTPKLKQAKKHIRELQLYAYMNNIGIIWRANKYGIDPDHLTASFPVPFSLSLGIRTKF